MKLVKLAAAAVLALSSFTASAGLLQIVGGNPAEAIAANNDFKPNFAANQQYTVGGNLQALQQGTYFLTYSLIGYEAGYSNAFNALAQTINNTTQKLNVINGAQVITAGNLNLAFDFATVQGGSVRANGSNVTAPANAGIYNFALALDVTYTAKASNNNNYGGARYYNILGTQSVFFDAVIFLDDYFTPTGDDDNHDDLIIGLKIVRAPEPSALLLMGLGLLGLAGARRLKA